MWTTRAHINLVETNETPDAPIAGAFLIEQIQNMKYNMSQLNSSLTISALNMVKSSIVRVPHISTPDT